MLESAQPGLSDAKIPQLLGLMKAMLEGGNIPAIGGYKSGNRYVINEGNHRMAAALELFKQTGNPEYVYVLLRNGRWDPIPSNLQTYPMVK